MNVFRILELSAVISTIVIALLLALVPVGVYLIARWREDKGGAPEPALGYVTVIGLIAWLGFTLGVVAIQQLLVQLIEDLGHSSLPLAFLASSVLIFVPAFFALRRRLPSRAARMYGGLALLGSSLSLVVAVVALMILLFDGDSRGLGYPVAMFIAHTPVVVVAGRWLARPAAPRAAA